MLMGAGMNRNMDMSVSGYGTYGNSSLSEAKKRHLDQILPENDPRRQTLGIDQMGEADRKTDEKADEKKIGRKSTPGECETCKNRKYQDGSNEGNVSFKSATHVAPEAAASAVRAHENMHVQNAYANAAEKNGKVVDASVTIKTSVCPECGRTYVSGGVTNTQIKYNNQSNPYQQNRMAEDAANLTGQKMNFIA